MAASSANAAHQSDNGLPEYKSFIETKDDAHEDKKDYDKSGKGVLHGCGDRETIRETDIGWRNAGGQ